MLDLFGKNLSRINKQEMLDSPGTNHWEHGKTQQGKPQGSSGETAGKQHSGNRTLRDQALNSYTDWMGFRCAKNIAEDKKYSKHTATQETEL